MIHIWLRLLLGLVNLVLTSTRIQKYIINMYLSAISQGSELFIGYVVDTESQMSKD